MMWICIAVIVFLYQYWYLLNRLRSFFLPFIIVYMQHEIAKSDIKDALPRQIFATIFMLYAIVFNYHNNIRADYAQSHTFDTITIFDLIDNDTEPLQKHQLEEANLYWDHDIDFAMERTK